MASKIIVFCVLLPLILAQSDPIVETSLGKLQGTVLNSRLGTPFFAFRGIRYAKAPVGDLRFLAPVPYPAWTGTYDATQDGSICPQARRENISEDCLVLNVYTKWLTPGVDPKPVIVYVPGGAFLTGSGSYEDDAGPDYLMERDVVLVTINYRLGSLGFLSTGTKEAPGNAAMKDQVLALKWVRDHINRFGGNPKLVTLFGESAGARSVSLHLVSPMSRGLFHRAILMSGSATTPLEFQSDQLNLTRRQAELVNCPTINIPEMVECLRQADFKELGTGYEKLKEFSVCPALVWLPAIEEDFGQERFLLEDPKDLFERGEFARVPIIAGITKEEYASSALDLVKDQELLERLDSDFNYVAPICFLYERDTNRSIEISQHLRQETFGDSKITKDSVDGIHNLFSDGVVGYGLNRLVNFASKHVPVYYYHVSYVGRYSLLMVDGKPYGCVHADDLTYILLFRHRMPLINETDPENLTVERFTRMWASFATTGYPIDQNDEFLKDIHWKSFTAKDQNYLDIGDELVERSGLYLDRYRIWEEALNPKSLAPRLLISNLTFLTVISVILSKIKAI